MSKHLPFWPNALESRMRPTYLTPKLTDSHRLEIRRLRGESPKTWTLSKLAGKFGVHRSTVSHVLRRRVRVSVEQELAAARLAVETSGRIQVSELMRLKHQEWSRQLLTERDLGRQQQLVNLIKSVTSLLESEKHRQREYQPVTEEDIRRATIALTAHLSDEERAAVLLDEIDPDSGSKPPMLQASVYAATTA